MALGNFTPKKFGVGSTSGSVSVYTVPAGKGAILKNVHIQNTGNTSANAPVTIQIAGSSPIKYYLPTGNEAVKFDRDINIALNAGDNITIVSNSAIMIHYVISGVEFDV